MLTPHDCKRFQFPRRATLIERIAIASGDARADGWSNVVFRGQEQPTVALPLFLLALAFLGG